MTDSLFNVFAPHEDSTTPHRIVSVQEWERLKLHYVRAAATKAEAHRRSDHDHHEELMTDDAPDS